MREALLQHKSILHVVFWIVERCHHALSSTNCQRFCPGLIITKLQGKTLLLARFAFAARGVSARTFPAEPSKYPQHLHKSISRVSIAFSSSHVALIGWSAGILIQLAVASPCCMHVPMWYTCVHADDPLRPLLALQTQCRSFSF